MKTYRPPIRIYNSRRPGKSAGGAFNRLPMVRILDLRGSGRKSPWCVVYYVHGAAKRRYFPSLNNAFLYRNELAAYFQFGANPGEEEEVNRLVAGTGFTKLALIKVAVEHLRSLHQVPPDTDPVATARYLTRLGVTALKAARPAKS